MLFRKTNFPIFVFRLSWPSLLGDQNQSRIMTGMKIKRNEITTKRSLQNHILTALKRPWVFIYADLEIDFTDDSWIDSVQALLDMTKNMLLSHALYQDLEHSNI
jgi:hypothetical protein